MAESLREFTGNYTYADILSSPEGERWELIDGIAYNMTPTPPRRHQEIPRQPVNAIRQFSPKSTMPGVSRAVGRAVAKSRGG